MRSLRKASLCQRISNRITKKSITILLSKQLKPYLMSTGITYKKKKEKLFRASMNNLLEVRNTKSKKLV